MRLSQLTETKFGIALHTCKYQSYRQTVEIYSLNSQLQSVHDLVVQQTILNFLVQPHTCLCQSHVEIEHHIL